MKKNFFKKIVAAIATTALAVSAAVVPAQDVKAAEVTKTVYVEINGESTADSVLINFWNWTGVTADTHTTTGAFDGWDPGPVALEKVEDGLYKATLKIDAATFVEDGNGITVYLGSDGATKIEVDPSWNNTDNWADVKADLVSADEAMCLSIDIAAWTLGKGEVPTADETPDTTPDTTPEETPKTGDMTAVLPVALLAVAAMAVVVVMKRKAIAE